MILKATMRLYRGLTRLGGGDSWEREGGPIERANWLTIGFDSWGAPPLRIWLDGLALK